MRYVVLTLSAVLLATAGLGYWLNARSSGPNRTRGPILTFPEVVDFGDVERGQIATARLTLGNDGDEDLVIREVRSNCSCAGLEREHEGTLHRVDSLRIAPGGRVQVVIRQAVNGSVGERVTNSIYLLTNAAEQPEVQLKLIVPRVEGSLEVYPQAVAFGKVTVGTPCRHVVEIIDRSSTPRKIARVASTLGERVKAELLPVEPAPWGGPVGGVLVARLAIDIDTTHAGNVDGRITLWAQSDEPLGPIPLAVAGCVTAPLTTSPSGVTLPVASDEGPVYRARCLCRSAGGEPFALKVESCPPGLKVSVAEPGEGDVARLVVIEVADPNPLRSALTTDPQVVKLTGRVGRHDVPLEVTVRFRRGRMTCADAGTPPRWSKSSWSSA